MKRRNERERIVMMRSDEPKRKKMQAQWWNAAKSHLILTPSHLLHETSKLEIVYLTWFSTTKSEKKVIQKILFRLSWAMMPNIQSTFKIWIIRYAVLSHTLFLSLFVYVLTRRRRRREKLFDRLKTRSWKPNWKRHSRNLGKFYRLHHVVCSIWEDKHGLHTIR